MAPSSENIWATLTAGSTGPFLFVAVANQFHHQHLNPYINYHRPCCLPVITTNAKGKQVKTYPYKAMMTPFENLKSLDGTQQ